MDLNQPPPGKMPHLRGLGGKVAPGRATGGRSRLWQFLGIILLAAVLGGPARLAGGGYQETGPSAKVQNAWLTASVSGAGTAAVASPTITFTQPSDVTVGASVALSASVSPPDTLPVLFSSGTPLVCTVASPVVPTVTTIAVGACTITAYQDGDPPRAAPDVSRSFQVLAPTITFVQPPDVTVGTSVALSASVSPPDRQLVLFHSGTPSVCTVADPAVPTVTTIAVGTCTITAYQDGDPPRAAPAVTQSFQVSPVRAGSVAQTITFGQPPGGKVGVRVTLSASASSHLPVSFRSGTPSVCTVAGRTVTTIAAGPCTITASQGGNARYAAAPDVSRSFQVNPATPRVARTRIIVLGAIVLVAAAAAAALVVRRRPWLHSHPPTAPGPSVRAVPHIGPPGLVSVHATGTDTTHTVCIEPSPGAGITTIEEARP